MMTWRQGLTYSLHREAKCYSILTNCSLHLVMYSSFMPLTTLEFANVLKNQVVKADFATHKKCLIPSNAAWRLKQG